MAIDDTPGKISVGGSSAAMQRPGQPASSREILLLGLGLIFLCLMLAYLFVSLWPTELASAKNVSGNSATFVAWFGFDSGFTTKLDARLLLLVMVTGALGSFIHTATSFSDFVGNRRLSTNWVWWYILRPFIAMALASIFYVAIRAGFMTGGGDPGTLNLFGIAAMAGMVGMFSKQATDKLSEVFDTLFRTAPDGGDVQRKEGLDNAVPVIHAVEPATLPRAGMPAVVTVKGSGFTPASVVRVRDHDCPTTLKANGDLSVTLQPADLGSDGALDLLVFTPPPGGGLSAAMRVVVGIDALGPHESAAGANDDEVDGCAVTVVAPTADEALPAARGGVG